ncbi:YihY/virulence factor BrkB family protein [Cellulomonas soli]
MSTVPRRTARTSAARGWCDPRWVTRPRTTPAGPAPRLTCTARRGRTNRVYEVEEGRPFWVLRPMLLLVTVALVVISVAVVSAVALSSTVVRSLGAGVGLSDVTVEVWSVVRWPLVGVLVVAAVALLYHATPNVRQPRFRWVSLGAVLALVAWVTASVGLGLYVRSFANYDRTYGSLGGVVVFLLWLWVTNVALLLGAELDAETERARQLQGGIEAEVTLRLPPRDTRASDRRRRRAEDDARRGRALRGAAPDDEDRP